MRLAPGWHAVGTSCALAGATAVQCAGPCAADGCARRWLDSRGVTARDGEELPRPRRPKTWSWSREPSLRRCGQRTGGCGVKPGIVRHCGASGPTPGTAGSSLARNWRRLGASNERPGSSLPGPGLGSKRIGLDLGMEPVRKSHGALREASEVGCIESVRKAPRRRLGAGCRRAHLPRPASCMCSLTTPTSAGASAKS